MQASRTGRFLVGMVMAMLVCQSNIALADTVAYWRFEAGPADGPVVKGGQPDGTFYAGVLDVSGHGNDLSAWSEGGWAGFRYRTDVPAAVVAQTGEANGLSVQNDGGSPAMFTQTGAPIQTITPAAFSIEASFKPEVGGHRTIVGRDSQGANTADLNLAAVYFQLQPDDSIAIKFVDVSGIWHEAISAPGAVKGFVYPDTASGRWYHAAAVSNGTILSVYLYDVQAHTGYQLVAQTDMTASASPNTALSAGTGDGGDWDAGNWSVGRGLWGGGHTDRFLGFIDEVRISDSALDPSQFLFAAPNMAIWPSAVDATPIDPPLNATVVAPLTCHAGQALDVTVTSDNPAVAKPTGTTGSAVVHFAAGSAGTQPLSITYGTPGIANFTLTAAGCPAGAGPALTVNVHAFESLGIQAPYDIMTVGQTQQATVTAVFGPLTRNVSAATSGTTYSVTPAGVITISPDGLITAVGSGTATVTATFNGVTTAPLTIAAMPVGHTVAYWRFEEGPANAPVPHAGGGGVWEPNVPDVSGNGNALSAWTPAGCCGYYYREDRPATSIPDTHATNKYSIQNSGNYPGMFTQTGSAISTMTPAAWTIEVSFKLQSGDYRTLVGRDSRGSATINGDLAALYFQVQPDNSIAIKYCDVMGIWHEAISDPNVVVSYPAGGSATGRWYHAAAVSDGAKLSVYLNDVTAGTGYQLMRQIDLTTSGSSNTALTAGTGDGGDWDPGNWTVGRGIYAGGHGDRAIGFLDEVRVSDVALDPSQFLFAPDYMVLWPSALQMAPVDSPVVSLVIPTSCNETQACDVTITSDNPSVAKVAGSNGTAVVHFAAGASRLQPIAIQSSGPGTAHFTLTSSNGCPVGPGAALTVTVTAAQSVSIEATYDLMQVGQTQPATVTAKFGAAGTRNVSAASTGTTYDVTPAGALTVGPDGLITAQALGTANITATYAGITSQPKTIVVAAPNSLTRMKVAGSGFLLVDLSALDASAGQTVWVNKGSLGDFVAIGAPAKATVSDQQGVTFDGASGYQGPLAPPELLGGQGRTIEVWALNPAIECTPCIETMVAWGHRGGPCASNLTFGFGDNPTWGAIGGWCDNGDMPWNSAGGSPPLGEWRHLVYTYDPNLNGGTTYLYDNGVMVNQEATGPLTTNPGYIDLAMQNNSANPMDLFNAEIGALSMAAVRVHDGALSADDVLYNYRAGIAGQGLIKPDLDLNGRVDAADFVLFSQCVTGARVPVTGDCKVADFDGDNDVDMADFGIYQRCFSGGLPAVPGCD